MNNFKYNTHAICHCAQKIKRLQSITLSVVVHLYRFFKRPNIDTDINLIIENHFLLFFTLGIIIFSFSPLLFTIVSVYCFYIWW